jgi:putative Ca2+/H+ antiporter (TMEM165/GDT1 family)
VFCIVTVVTVLFALPFDAAWWPWALGIGLIHTAIDAGWLWVDRRWQASRRSGRYPIVRLMIDQLLHLSVIAGALIASGIIAAPDGLISDLAATFLTHRWLSLALGYVFITLPAWILIEFTFYALINGSAPDFTQAAKNKYPGSLERSLMLTFVLLGQFALVPLVALPRLVLDSPTVIGQPRAALYLAEWLGSLAIAIAIGLMLKNLTGV